VNLDMMFALPGQTAEEWAADVREALALKPDHLSTYCLTFEEDTALWVKLSQGRVKLDTEHEARLYEATWAQLAAAGYAQYEVSNFARPGHQCLHNANGSGWAHPLPRSTQAGVEQMSLIWKSGRCTFNKVSA
jgi:oxygen-independent coproporphyrinogen-3 oxidase